MHNEYLKSLGFPEPFQVEGRSSIADLYKPGHRCGIYVLGFTNGDFYCGQAVDVTRRYVQHSKNHLDISQVRFQEVGRSNLNEVEQHCIHQMEAARFRMRNITFMSVIEGETDFDLIMPPDEQSKWVNDLNWIDTDTIRVKDEDLRNRYTRSFRQLESLEDSKKVINALRLFVQSTIPAIHRSELSFWTVSCMPKYNSSRTMIYSRVNINWQEVFTIGKDPYGSFISIHLAKSNLQEKYGNSLFLLKGRIPRLEIINHRYSPGGQDQIELSLNPVNLHRLLEQPDVVKACRLFNLRLMRKGPSNFARYHCLDLADRLI